MIVTTCQSGYITHGIGLPRGFFTHIFIDEAGQATEAETLASIRTMADTKTKVVLSGSEAAWASYQAESRAGAGSGAELSGEVNELGSIRPEVLHCKRVHHRSIYLFAYPTYLFS
jgi:hypothetical protein